jgi:ferredoxin
VRAPGSSRTSVVGAHSSVKITLLVICGAFIIVCEMRGEGAPQSSVACESFNVTLVTPYGERVIRARASEHILDEAQAAGINLPAICRQGRCLTCAGELLAQGEFDPSDAVGYYAQDREAGYILLCTAKVLSDLRIRTHRQTEMREHRKKIGLPAPYA